MDTYVGDVVQGGLEGQAAHVYAVHASAARPLPGAPATSRPHSATAVVAIADVIS